MNNIETNHTIEEYMSRFGEDYLNGNLYDFEKQDFNEGIEFKDNIIYWLINDRYYETSLSSKNTVLKESLNEDKKKKHRQKYPVHYIGMFGYGPLYNNGSLVPPTPKPIEPTIHSAPVPTLSAGSSVPPTSPVGNPIGQGAAVSSASAGVSEALANSQINWNDTCFSFLYLTDFSLVKHDDKEGMWSLEDKQKGNLGDIESFRFDKAEDMFDRMSTYFDDYIFAELEDIVDVNDLPEDESCSGWVDWYTDDMKKKYNNIDGCIEFCDMIANHANDIDLNVVYKIQNGANSSKENN
jgi:hypothetical protein